MRPSISRNHHCGLSRSSSPGNGPPGRQLGRDPGPRRRVSPFWSRPGRFALSAASLFASCDSRAGNLRVGSGRVAAPRLLRADFLTSCRVLLRRVVGAAGRQGRRAGAWASHSFPVPPVRSRPRAHLRLGLGFPTAPSRTFTPSKLPATKTNCLHVSPNATRREPHAPALRQAPPRSPSPAA